MLSSKNILFKSIEKLLDKSYLFSGDGFVNCKEAEAEREGGRFDVRIRVNELVEQIAFLTALQRGKHGFKTVVFYLIFKNVTDKFMLKF